ncbi:hypothetical protein [Zoogloea sp.]|uniref:hypothetical protein n=1 Tax=Zoogloea sp. TaxID=49181 RepID=UPI0035AE8E57
MKHHLSRTLRIPLAGIACATLAACGTTSLGDNLGAGVTANGSTVSLQWDELHGWDGLLSRRGAELVAEYQSGSSGWVREALSTGQQAGQRVLRFTLPPTLKGRANGPVCLYIQVTTNRALLPVRKPGQLGEDSARFRYPEWEQAAFENTAKQLKQNELTALDAQRAQLDTTLAQQTKALEQRGWQTEAHCDRISVQTANRELPPPGVLPPEKQSDAARQVCVARMLLAKTQQQRMVQAFLTAPSLSAPQALEALGGAQSLAGQTARLAENILELKPSPKSPITAEVLQGRQKEARAFLADWQTFLPSVQRKDPLPYGDMGRPATIVSSARPIQRMLLLRDLADKIGINASEFAYQGKDTLALGGAMLDSYSGCVDDARKELKMRQQTWSDLQRDNPERMRRIRDHYVQSCHAGFTQLGQIARERDRLIAETDKARQQASAVGNQSPSAAILASVRDKPLNRAACQ